MRTLVSEALRVTLRYEKTDTGLRVIVWKRPDFTLKRASIILPDAEGLLAAIPSDEFAARGARIQVSEKDSFTVLSLETTGDFETEFGLFCEAVFESALVPHSGSAVTAAGSIDPETVFGIVSRIAVSASGSRNAALKAIKAEPSPLSGTEAAQQYIEGEIKAKLSLGLTPEEARLSLKQDFLASADRLDTIDCAAIWRLRGFDILKLPEMITWTN